MGQSLWLRSNLSQNAVGMLVSRAASDYFALGMLRMTQKKDLAGEQNTGDGSKRAAHYLPDIGCCQLKFL